MAPIREALAKKLQSKSAPQPSPSLLNRTERRLSVFLREIETDAVSRPQPKIARPSDSSLLRTFILTDVTALIAGFLCAWLLAVAVNTIFLGRYDFAMPDGGDALLILQFVLLGGGIVLWFGHTGHYQLRMPFWMETKKIVEALGFAMLISCFLLFVSKENFSRLWLLSYWAFSITGIIALRVLWRSILRGRGHWQIPTLIIGDGPTAEEARLALNSEPSLGYNIVAQIKELPRVFQLAGHSWKTLCETYGADYVLIALDGDDFMDARPSLAQLMREHVPFSVSPPMQNLSVYGMEPQCFLGHDVMLLTRNNGLDRPLPRFLKRGFDILVSTVTLLALSPMLLAIALIVKLDGGPAFYRHKRIGLNGEVFSCLKFRSMCVKSEEVLAEHLEKYPLARAEWQRDHKLRKDPRVTPVGSILRRTSMDELPQLLNVLEGDMSIVGPRPIIVAETAKYHNDIAYYYRVRPGITGLWQVSGRNDVSYDDRVRMDSWYVRNWSLWHDITIICKTFTVVLKQDGAY